MFPSSFSSSPSRLLYFQLTPSSLKFDMLPKLLTSSRAIFVYNYGISLRDFFNYHQLLWTISMQTWSFMMVNESWNYHRLSSTIMTDWTGLKRMWTLRVKIFLTGVHIDEFFSFGSRTTASKFIFHPKMRIWKLRFQQNPANYLWGVCRNKKQSLRYVGSWKENCYVSFRQRIVNRSVL